MIETDYDFLIEQIKKVDYNAPLDANGIWCAMALQNEALKIQQNLKEPCFVHISTRVHGSVFGTLEQVQKVWTEPTTLKFSVYKYDGSKRCSFVLNPGETTSDVLNYIHAKFAQTDNKED